MTFSQHDHVIQAFPTDRSDYAFRVGVLPRRPGRGDDFFDAERFDLPQKSISIDRIAISDQVARCLGRVAGFNELTRCPSGSGMGSDIEVTDMAAIVA
jgi:hypothetical protein